MSRESLVLTLLLSDIPTSEVGYPVTSPPAGPGSGWIGRAGKRPISAPSAWWDVHIPLATPSPMDDGQTPGSRGKISMSRRAP